MIDAYTHAVEALLDKLKSWAQKQQNWTIGTESDDRNSSGSDLPYTSSGFSIYTEEGRVHIEPIGQKTDGSGVVEIFAWPSLIRVRLLQKPGNDVWKATTDNGLTLTPDLTEPAFVSLVQDMLPKG